VVNYSNNQATASTVNLTDVIGTNQAYVSGSLQIPSGLNAQFSTNSGTSWTAGAPPAGATGVGATGTVAPSSTVNGSKFTTSTVNFTTPGGDGWSIEGIGSNLYTYYHHQNPVTVFCQTLQNTNCSGMTAPTTSVDSNYRTAQNAGSFLIGTKLYTPVVGHTTSVIGVYCFDTSTNTSCGFIQTGTNSAATDSWYFIADDGIPASNGNYYFIDITGKLTCFNGAVCGTFTNLFGSNTTAYTWNSTHQSPVNMVTYGQYVFASRLNTNGNVDFACFNTATNSLCTGFPKSVGPAGTGWLDEIYPILDGTGATLGACVRIAQQSASTVSCFSTSGASMTDPYPSTIGGFTSPTNSQFAANAGGAGQGVVVGNRFYSWNSPGLPLTGADGQIILNITGIALMLLAAGGVLLMIRRRRHAHHES
jgi:LPXTG-motif cell wall-anchored protein